MEEFLKTAYDLHTAGPSPVVAVGGLATLANTAAAQVLSPEEIYHCLEHVRRPDVPDGVCEAAFDESGTRYRFDIKSIASARATLGRVARVERIAPSVGGASDLASSTTGSDPDYTLDGVVRSQIVKTLGLAQGNRVRAAQMLGISRSALYRKLALYGLEWC
ncbi:helix-turn-helix domain-containing protein [Prescottella agglutinans]|uniref:helix-turn-helix domain-containing protein n=1 Tax=Prescottella agglutinans TaxID=1644129 RepID=UPI002474838C|nr:helix-turn-helix domain-containing protein [Prescottella agglutinans]